MSAFTRMFAGAAVMFSLGAPAAGSLIDLETPTHSFLPDEPPAEAYPGLWDRFKVSFDQHADEEFAHRLHPFRLMHRTREGGLRLMEESEDRMTDVARRGFSVSATSGLRESLLELDLPVLTWLRERSEFLADAFYDSVDSVAEERMAPLDLTYHETRRSWWHELARSDRVRYGLRPFRTSPYAFVSWRVHDGDHVHLLGHVRYRFRNFAEHSFELAFSVPMTRRISLEFGTAYQIGEKETGQTIVAKLSKAFMSNGQLHVGMQAQGNPVLVAGLSVSW